jgi:hypothetical protein
LGLAGCTYGQTAQLRFDGVTLTLRGSLQPVVQPESGGGEESVTSGREREVWDPTAPPGKYELQAIKTDF